GLGAPCAPLALVLVLRRLRIGVAARPEDLLELDALGAVLEARVGLALLGQDDAGDVFEPLLAVLVELFGHGRQGPDEREHGERRATDGHVSSPWNQDATTWR